MSDLMNELQACAAKVREKTDIVPDFGLVLGSGLGFLAEKVENPVSIDYEDLPGFPVSTVEGHASRLVLGDLSGRKVAIMQGRFHYYEGYPMHKLVMGVRLMAMLGAKAIIVTNAAGGIRHGMKAGELMLIQDHINFMGDNPLIGENPKDLGTRFPDMSDAYTGALREQARAITVELKIPVTEGVYAAFTGPSYETPAEIRLLGKLGADAVGMSTIPEVIAASHMQLKVLGISCISNLASGISDQPLSHAEVTETAERVREVFSTLVLELVGRLNID